MAQSERNEFFDLMRGLGILTVVFAHLFMWGSPVRKAIYAFHMPLFFFLSGVFLTKLVALDFRGVVRRIGRNIVTPMVLLLLISVPPFVVRTSTFQPLEMSWKQMVWSFVSGLPCVNGACWFLIDLAIGQFLSYFIIRRCEKSVDKKRSWFLFFALMVFVSMFVTRVPPGIRELMPLKIMSWPVVLIAINAGYLCRNLMLKVSCSTYRLFDLIVIFCVTTMAEIYIALTNKPFSVDSSRFESPAYFVTIALGIVAVAVVAKMLERFQRGAMCRGIAFFGRNSLACFGLEAACVRPFVLFGLSLLFPNVSITPATHTNSMIVTMIAFMVIMLILSALAPLLNRLIEGTKRSLYDRV